MNGFDEIRFTETLMIKNLEPNTNLEYKRKALEVLFQFETDST